jgi:hypothetical protein
MRRPRLVPVALTLLMGSVMAGVLMTVSVADFARQEKKFVVKMVGSFGGGIGESMGKALR